MGLQDAEDTDPSTGDDEDLLNDDEDGGGSPDELAAAKGHFPGIGHPAHPTSRVENPQIQQLRAAMMNDRSGAQLIDARKSATDQARNGALLAALAKGSAQIGSFHGKVADTSAVGDEAKALAGAAAADYQGKADEVARRQKVNQYLLGGLQKRDLADAQISSREKVAGNKKPPPRTPHWAPTQPDESGNVSYVDTTSPTPPPSYKLGAKPKAGGGTGGNADPKEWERLGKELVEGTASSRGGMGKNKSMIDNADRVLALGKQGDTQNGGLDKRQIHEVAIASAGLVGGGSSPAQSTVEALVPRSWGHTAAGIEEWLTSEPQGTGQQAFVKRMLETAQREKELAQDKIIDIKSDVLAGHSHLQDEDNARWSKLVGHHFGPDAEFDDTGHYKRQPKKEATPKTPQTGGTAPKTPPPAAKAPEDMSDADLDAEISRLKSGK